MLGPTCRLMIADVQLLSNWVWGVWRNLALDMEVVTNGDKSGNGLQPETNNLFCIELFMFEKLEATPQMSKLSEDALNLRKHDHIFRNPNPTDFKIYWGMLHPRKQGQTPPRDLRFQVVWAILNLKIQGEKGVEKTSTLFTHFHLKLHHGENSLLHLAIAQWRNYDGSLSFHLLDPGDGSSLKEQW